MPSVVDRDVVMRRIPVYEFRLVHDSTSAASSACNDTSLGECLYNIYETALHGGLSEEDQVPNARRPTYCMLAAPQA